MRSPTGTVRQFFKRQHWCAYRFWAPGVRIFFELCAVEGCAEMGFYGLPPLAFCLVHHREIQARVHQALRDGFFPLPEDLEVWMRDLGLRRQVLEVLDARD